MTCQVRSRLSSEHECKVVALRTLLQSHCEHAGSRLSSTSPHLLLVSFARELGLADLPLQLTQARWRAPCIMVHSLARRDISELLIALADASSDGRGPLLEKALRAVGVE